MQKQQTETDVLEPLAPSEFLDSVIVLLASRHGADTNNVSDSELPAASTVMAKRWQEVARDMQALAKSPSCRGGDLRIVSNMVDDSEAFSAAACLHRARFALYRMQKEQEAAKAERARRKLQQRNANAMNRYADPRDPQPSGFDVTKGHSIADAMQQIMADAQRRIAAIVVPQSSSSINNMMAIRDRSKSGAGCEDLEDSDEDDGQPVQLFRPPAGYGGAMSEEEQKAAMEAGAAEDELMTRVHALQLDHFRKHRRWVNFGTGESSPSAPDLEANNSNSPARKNAALPAIEDMTPDDVAEMLGGLKLGEHISRFRRTSGPLLATMSKDDVRIRFDGDTEATDMLWHHIETKMQRRNSSVITNTKGGAAAAPARKLADHRQQQQQQQPAAKRRAAAVGAESGNMRAIYDAIAAPSTDLAAMTQDLDAFEEQHVNGGGSGGQSDIRNQLRAGNFQALKRTLDLLEHGGAGANNNNDDNNNSEHLVSVYADQQQKKGAERPLRPSHHQQQQRAAAGGAAEDGADFDTEQDIVAGAVMGQRHDSKSEQMDARAILTSGAGAGRGGGAAGGGGGRGGYSSRGGRGGGSNSAQPAAAAAAAAASSSKPDSVPPARGSRFAIIEYSDDDDVE